MKGVAHTVLVGADALDQVTEPLHQNAAAQHVGEGGNVLAVSIGLVEREVNRLDTSRAKLVFSDRKAGSA